MFAPVNAVSPGSDLVDERGALVRSELLGRAGPFPRWVGVQRRKGKPVCELVFLEVGIGEDDERGQ